MKKPILLIMVLATVQLVSAQYYIIPTLNAGSNPGKVNPDGENPYPSSANAGWTNLWNGDASAVPEYTTEQTIPFAFKFNGSSVQKYTASNFGTVSFNAGTPSTKPTGFSNISLPSADIPNNSVCALGIVPKSVTSGANTYKSAVMTKTYGKSPNRQHWIWFNFFGEANISNGWTYWAVVLEETTNNIHIVDMKTLCVTSAGQLCNENVKMSLGIQLGFPNATSVSGSPEVGAQQIKENIFTAADNSFYTFIQGNQPKNDLTCKSITVNKYLMLKDAPFTISADFENFGSAKVSSAEIGYSINNGAPVVGSASGVSISSLGKQSLSSPNKWTPSVVGVYDLKVWPAKVNGVADENTSNDTAYVKVNVIDKFAVRKILNEVFTSSTCGPCTPGNANYLRVIDGKNNHSSIKYQVYWPGTGDPYCTQEVRDRTLYYAINSVPRMEVDGGWDGNASSFTNAVYDEFQGKPSFLEITGNVSLTWKNKISLNLALTPLAAFNSNNLKLHAVVVEGTTYSNKKSNGEIQFESVMKKMIPNSSGTVLTALTKGVMVNKALTYTFNGPYRLSNDGSTSQHINHLTENSIETWNDLSVVVFVQDAATKEVLQSATFPIAMVGVEAVDQNMMLYPNPANDIFTIEVPDMVNANVVVTNLQGKLVYNGILESGKAQMMVASWAEGIYFVNVSGNNKNVNSKIVVRH